jgi:hypothetical protein
MAQVLVVMRKLGSACLVVGVALLLLGVILFEPPKLGPGVLDAESNFYPALHNSLLGFPSI